MSFGQVGYHIKEPHIAYRITTPGVFEMPTKKYHKLILPAIIAAFYAAAPANATEDDFGAWAILTTGGAISKDEKLVVAADLQFRFFEDAEQLGQILARASAGYKVDDDLTLSLGYAYIRNNPSGPALSEENRIFQQASFNIIDNDSITVKGRSRFEQRFLDGGSNDVGLRFRQQVSVAVPLGDNSKTKLVGYTEPFINVNNTDFGQDDGFALWRNFVGFNIPVSKDIAIEPGYLNQYVFRDGGPDLAQHIIAVGLKTKF